MHHGAVAGWAWGLEWVKPQLGDPGTNPRLDPRFGSSLAEGLLHGEHGPGNGLNLSWMVLDTNLKMNPGFGAWEPSRGIAPRTQLWEWVKPQLDDPGY